jgi:hypothetical protein
VSTVQVITAPTDWAAVVAAAVTGVAAIAGIAGTAWQASSARKDAVKAREIASRELDANTKAAADNLNKSIRAAADNLDKSTVAENRRAEQAQKVRIYASFQGAVDDIIAVASRTKQQEGEFSNAHSVMLKASAEVGLIAPKDIGDLAERITRSVSDSIGPLGVRANVDPQHTIERHRKDLTIKMRADLETYRTRPAPAVAGQAAEAAPA